MHGTIACKQCGTSIAMYKNPVPTVDVLIAQPGDGIVLVRRRNEPRGWALPGGFVDYGESVEAAALREAREETGLDVTLHELLGVYSRPDRDPRQHTISTVFIATTEAAGHIQGGDDAAEARFFPLDSLPALVFDHAEIVHDFVVRHADRYGLAYAARQQTMTTR